MREKLMTVGELARRTGLPHKSIRELEALGLIYSAGRSEANYRLFNDSALWCVRAIKSLRSLGLTLKEIEQLSAVYLRPAAGAARPAPRRAPASSRAATRAAARRAARD